MRPESQLAADPEMSEVATADARLSAAAPFGTFQLVARKVTWHNILSSRPAKSQEIRINAAILTSTRPIPAQLPRDGSI
jgi:hypothetical protein